jgi:hypothetical protein
MFFFQPFFVTHDHIAKLIAIATLSRRQLVFSLFMISTKAMPK